jgi:hypothetical protein
MAFPSVEWEEIRARFTNGDTRSTAMKCQGKASRAEIGHGGVKTGKLLRGRKRRGRARGLFCFLR